MLTSKETSDCEPYAFISYSRQDSEFALRLASDLKALGAIVWLDELNILPGHQWDRAVADALADCTWMLVVLSPDSVASRNVTDEVSWALGKGKIVIPVFHRDCEIPFRWDRMQRVDFRREYEPSLRRLISALSVRGSGVVGDSVQRGWWRSTQAKATYGIALGALLLSAAWLKEQAFEDSFSDGFESGPKPESWSIWQPPGQTQPFSYEWPYGARRALRLKGKVSMLLADRLFDQGFLLPRRTLKDFNLALTFKFEEGDAMGLLVRAQPDDHHWFRKGYLFRFSLSKGPLGCRYFSVKCLRLTLGNREEVMKGSVVAIEERKPEDDAALQFPLMPADWYTLHCRAQGNSIEFAVQVFSGQRKCRPGLSEWLHLKPFRSTLSNQGNVGILLANESAILLNRWQLNDKAEGDAWAKWDKRDAQDNRNNRPNEKEACVEPLSCAEPGR